MDMDTFFEAWVEAIAAHAAARTGTRIRVGRKEETRVPLDWQRCGAARCAGTGVPLLADQRASEYGSDPFFEFFETRVYIAIPLRVRGKVTAVLAADNDDATKPIAVEDISLVYSMAQQAATAIERLMDNSDNARAKTLAWRNSWSVPEMTAKVAAAVREHDSEKRAEIYAELQREHQRVSPFIILLQAIEVAAMRAKVSGLDIGPTNDRIYYAGTTKG